MNILDRLRGNRLDPLWEFSPEGTIWKLLPAGDRLIVGEARDLEGKTLSLFSIDITDGVPRFRGMRLEEPWWVALEMVIGDIMLMHAYPRPDLPTAVGVTAIDAGTGGILWRDDSLRILCGTDDIALAQRGSAFDYGNLLFVDLRTGEALEELGANTDRAADFQRICSERGGWPAWINSETLDEEDTRLLTLAPLLTRSVGERRGAVEFAEFGPYTILSLHERSKRSARAMLAGAVDGLLLVARDGRTIYRETIAPESPGPVDDAFFIWHGILIFVRGHGTLVAIDLNRA